MALTGCCDGVMLLPARSPSRREAQTPACDGEWEQRTPHPAAAVAGHFMWRADVALGRCAAQRRARQLWRASCQPAKLAASDG